LLKWLRKQRKSASPEGYVHPYVRWENTPLWKAIEKGVADLVENQDLVETEAREYIVGYLCKIVERRKAGIVSQLGKEFR
jgi:hypothetical protein